MELTYTNHNRVEQGVIQDFTLDLAYGKDENDFEIVTSENVLQQGYYWYVPDTEYGGIVDEIEATTNQTSVTYRGRSLQGILDTYNMLEIEAFDGLVIDNDNLIINALPSQILNNIISQLQLPFSVISEDDVVNMTVERNQGVYSFLRSICEPNNYKIKFDTFTITITGTMDYASDDYFDTTQYAVKVNNSSKMPNHLIGVFKRDGENTIVKHLYFNEEGEVQPYYQLDSMHGFEPLHDYEYERVPDNKVITGIDEVVEVIEGGSTVETMDLVTELTDTNGNTPFVDGKPYDWEEKCYTDYYLWDDVSETGEVQYRNPEIENEYEPFTVDDSQPLKPADVEYSFNWWKNRWQDCYKKDGSEYIQLSESDCTTQTIGTRLDNFPNDWEKNYAKYSYKVSDGVYQNYEGVPVYAYDRQRKQGSAWSENKGDFYIYVQKKRWKIIPYIRGKKGKTDYIYDSLKNKTIDGTHTFYQAYGNVKKTFSSPKGNKYTSAKYKIYAPEVYWKGWMSLTDYCTYAKKKLDDIKWKDNTYALKYEKYRVAPTNVDYNNIYLVWDEITDTPEYKTQGGVYKTFYFPKDLIKPAYKQGLYYRKVKNNYGELIKTMLEKYNDIVSKLNVIEPQIDTDLMEFDVGDIIGSVHPFTHEQLQAKIGKKIVKGGTKGITVSYEIG